MSGTLGDEKCLPVGKKIAGQFLRGFPCNWAELIKQVHRVDEPKASQNEYVIKNIEHYSWEIYGWCGWVFYIAVYGPDQP